MRYIIQQFSQDRDNVPTIYIELHQEHDLSKLFAEGYIRLPTLGSDGEILQDIVLFLKGRGITPDAGRRPPRD